MEWMRSPLTHEVWLGEGSDHSYWLLALGKTLDECARKYRGFYIRKTFRKKNVLPLLGLLVVRAKALLPRPVVNRAANAFRLAAQAVSHSHSALGAFYRRLRSRLGAPKAITATAHKLARLFYLMWTQGKVYADPGLDYSYSGKVCYLARTLHSKLFELSFSHFCILFFKTSASKYNST